MVYELNGSKNVCIFGNVKALQIILRNEIPGNKNFISKINVVCSSTNLFHYIMVLCLTSSLVHAFDPQKNRGSKLIGDIMDFCYYVFVIIFCYFLYMLYRKNNNKFL